MNLEAILHPLGLGPYRAVIEPGWAESSAAMPEGELFFLDEDFIREGSGYCGMNGDMTAAAVEAAGRISRETTWRALIWQAHRRMYHGGPSIAGWPGLAGALGAHAGLFYALALLSNWPQAREIHRAHSVPADVVRDTMADVPRHLDRHRRRRGAYGVEPLYAGGWLRNHLRGRIYQLGRLQFISTAFPAVCSAWRRPGDGRVIALAAPDASFRRDGQRNGAGGLVETDGAWTSVLREDAAGVTGHPIDPMAGAVRREAVRLDLNEWQPVLRPGDPVLDIHIPATGPVPPHACAESAERALQFFPRYFPENPPPRALICTTWMLDAQLAGRLKPDSNILRFQRAFYRYPVECDRWSAFRFVFDLEIPYGSDAPVETAALPRDTTLQRALLEHVEDGGRWRKSGGFILTEDLPWGREAYRSAAESWTKPAC